MHIVPTGVKPPKCDGGIFFWDQCPLAFPQTLRYRSGMSKTVFIKVRVTPEEKQAFLEASEQSGKPLSESIRASLARFVKKVMK